MDNNILVLLVKGLPVSRPEVENALYEMCDREHAQCNDACLVYELNGHKPLNGHRPFEQNRGCDCFKNGRVIYDFIFNTVKTGN